MFDSHRPVIGRLVPVDPRQAWPREAQDLTPWMALPENITMVGETIGIDLEVLGVEQPVGPFRADLLCRDTITGGLVLIENQFGRTDHDHLGKLLTYAAGLDAATIVWIAERFADEHRAALDRLNSSTVAGFDFFGAEIELWRIGASDYAPRFNLVAKPNEWGKTVRERAAGELSPTQQLHFDFWTYLKDCLDQRGSPIRLRPTTQSVANFAVGRSGFTLVAWNSMAAKSPGIVVEGVPHHSGVYLRISGTDAATLYGLLEERHRGQIDAALAPLGGARWQGPGAGMKWVAVSWPSTPWDAETWPSLCERMATSLESMKALFKPLVAGWDTSEGDAEV